MKRTLSLFVALAALLPTAGVGARADTPTTIYAHRGGAGLAPENTVGAFRQTAARWSNAVWLEMDTQLTSDGKLVIIHDDSLDRTTTCKGTVISKTFATITQCDASKSFAGWPTAEPVPGTEAVLREGRASGWNIMIELKDIPGEANFDPACNAATELIAALDRSAFPSARLIVESFWPPCLDQIKLRAPATRVMLLTTSQLPHAPPGGGFTLTEGTAYTAARAYEIISPDNATLDLNHDTVGLAHAAGRQVIVWTVDDTAGIEQMRAAGVDGIISNRPDLAVSEQS